ncbi:MAG: aminopeptidase [Odoribacter sp.]|nr:aminopeptidase [Odoribacter sp.]
MYEAGVSEELARWRKATVKDLEYDLFFSIPAERNEAVEGKVTVTFALEKAQEIIFDWRFDRAESCTVDEVNGEKPAVVFYRNEHIIVPAENWQAGENKVTFRFTSDDQSLNRNEEFLYTLLVPDRARTLFPCFDQPDLKARFTLSLEVPEEWQAVSNTYVLEGKPVAENRRVVYFAPTEPLSTYLFSFVTGKLQRREYRADGRRISAYYRETDPKKVAQLDTIFGQVAHSLRWLEEFTGVPYPFAKYDFIILPGFQYGGMEHTGATLYNDTRMFLGEHPTPDEELNRAQLIAHETAHMWFGDYVTMAWFDDVWTKEVFANYFAACISEPMFPAMNHELTWLRGYTAASLAEDRTAGTTAIKQPLENLNNAGLIYGKIIYNKAPVMMKKLVGLMGEEAFREGIREYVRTFGFGNATWEELVAILDRCSEADLQAFSRVWVHEKGMPHISFAQKEACLEIRQSDPYGCGLVWPQSFCVRLCGERDTTVEVRMTDTLTRVVLPFEVAHIVPNTDGLGYGLLMPDDRNMDWLLRHWQTIPDETARQAAAMLLYENYLAKRVDDRQWVTAVFNGLKVETNPLIASTLARYAAAPLWALGDDRASWEEKYWQLAQTHAIPSCRTQLLRMLMTNYVSESVGDKMHALWI